MDRTVKPIYFLALALLLMIGVSPLLASTSSCAVSRSTILSGQHGHVNGMYGHQHSPHHFSSFKHVQSLPVSLKWAG